MGKMFVEGHQVIGKPNNLHDIGLARAAAAIEDELEAEDEREAIQTESARACANATALLVPRITLRHIADIVAELREPLWLGGLHQILERCVLAVLAGPRATFKSFIALHWAMLAAVNGHAVVILSAEGGGLDRRIAAWMKTHAPGIDLRSLHVVALERAVNLNLKETFEALDAAITACGILPDLILVDTFSKYAPGLDENDNTAVALYLSDLSEKLRHRYNSTVLLVTHSGHADARRPRGASVLRTNPDAEYMVDRPNGKGMTATVTRERFKDSPVLGRLAYVGEVVDLGRVDSHGDSVTSLVMRDFASEIVPTGNIRTSELRGKAQKELLTALRAFKAERGVDVLTIDEIRAIGRKAGMSKGTARSAAEGLTRSSHLIPSGEGWVLQGEHRQPNG